MFKAIDYFLDRITMYRLVLYVLIALIGIATVLSLFSIIQFSPLAIVFSAFFLFIICWTVNVIISAAFDAPTNVESAIITALILALIITPATSINDYMLLFWAGVLSMASKYILAIDKKHIFNPAAIAMVITGYALGQSASWWVGTAPMAPFVAISGFLIIRKLRFSDLAWSFFTTAIVVSLGMTILKGGSAFTTFEQISLHSSFLFLGSIMLTEPLTLPPTKNLQMIDGVIVGALSVPQVHIGPLYFPPELALCIGNVYSYIVSPKTKLLLFLKEKLQISSDAMDFVFHPAQKFVFAPGQYMEWTLPHQNADSRGNRRYFTLASSPTEDTVRLGVKFYAKGSTYKKALYRLDHKTPIVAAQIAGDFTLPRDPRKKIAFLAGGIGITPYRSMTKYLIDKNERRDIVLLYANKKIDEIAYVDVFNTAFTKLGIRTYYTLTDIPSIPSTWQGGRGRIDAQMIQQTMPDYKDRMFYLSGPQTMVKAYEEVLQSIGVKQDHIKKDFFPGLV